MDGRSATEACEGQNLTFVCTVPGSRHEWTSSLNNNNDDAAIILSALVQVIAWQGFTTQLVNKTNGSITSSTWIVATAESGINGSQISCSNGSSNGVIQDATIIILSKSINSCD